MVKSREKEEEDDSAINGEKMHYKSKTYSQEEEQSNPLIFKLADDPASVKTSRWFSNPLFESIENTARSASFAAAADHAADDYDAAEEEEEDAIQDLDSDDEGDSRPTKKRKMQLRQSGWPFTPNHRSSPPFSTEVHAATV